MKIMRSNYDKPRRCPNWSGPAWKNGGGPCPGGMLTAWHTEAHPERMLQKCTKCGTLVLPNVLKWLDATWIGFRLKRKWTKVIG